MEPAAVPVVPVDAADAVAQVVEALQAGGAVVLPTDTVYGLAALPTDAAAVGGLFALKGRDASVPVAVLCADVEQALGLATPLPVEVRAVLERWWPGPLTVVATRRPGVVLHLGEPAGTVGLRVPDHPFVRAVAAAVGPLATTSANQHGHPTPATAADAVAALGPGVALAVDGGELHGAASTVLDVTETPWRVLREGALRESDIRAAAAAAEPGDQ